MLSEVPSGWEVCPLHGIAKIQMGETLIAKDLTGDGVPVFSAGRGSEPWGYTSRSRKLFRRGTIIIGARGTLGFPRLPDLDAYISTQTTIAVTPGNRADARFLSAFLSTIDYEKLGAQQAVPMLTIESLSSARVLLAPLLEQKKIAAILSSVDEAIQATQAVIDQTRRVKEGLLQDLLTRGIGHTRFKQTEIGEIPEGWEVRRLDEAVSPDRHVTYGIVQTGEHVPDGIPCVRVTDIVCDEIDVPQMIRTSNAISSSYGRTVLQAGDIMMALRGDIGHVRIVDDALVGCNLTRGVALIAPSNEFVPQYLLWALRSPGTRNDILRRVNGSALQEVPLGSLRQVLVACPPRSEQVIIADRMECAERAASSQKRVLDSLRRMKSGLLTDLLTGKVRVTP